MRDYTSIVSSNNVVDVEFPIEYTNTPAIFVLNKYPAENSNDWYGDLQSASEASFRFNTRKVNATNAPINWLAIGY